MTTPFVSHFILLATDGCKIESAIK